MNMEKPPGLNSDLLFRPSVYEATVLATNLAVSLIQLLL
jgi:hypothetical protein